MKNKKYSRNKSAWDNMLNKMLKQIMIHFMAKIISRPITAQRRKNFSFFQI
jgi:hypothetical protein